MQVIHEELSPHRNLQAIVEEEEGVVYFYLYGGEDSDFGMRSCWVQNLVQAPEDIDFDMLAEGKAPLMPARFCKHPQGSSPLTPENLRVVFFEEGDAAALLDKDEVVAVIPSWSGEEGFYGYARDCIGESPLAFELTDDNPLLERVHDAEAFWLSWESPELNEWTELQSGQIAAYERAIAPHEKYYAIDGGLWPPKAILQIGKDGTSNFLSIGVCIRPQPKIEYELEPDSKWRRIELGLSFSSQFDSSMQMDFARYLSAITDTPWQKFTWFGPGHTIACDFIEGYEAFLLIEANEDEEAQIQLPKYKGEQVSLLWLVALRPHEFELAVNEGSQAALAELARARPDYRILRPLESLLVNFQPD